MLLFLFCPVITVKGCERRLSLESGHEDASALYKPQGPSVCGSKLGRGGLWGVRSGHLGLNRATELTVKKCISEWPVLTLSHHCSLDYKEDPYSKGDPCNTICCREDLNSHNPSPGGCYDTKSLISQDSNIYPNYELYVRVTALSRRESPSFWRITA